MRWLMKNPISVNEERANARLVYMDHLASIAKSSERINQDVIIASGSTVSERLDWISKLSSDFDAIGIGIDWMLRDPARYNTSSRHNSPVSFIDMISNNKAKSQVILSILTEYFEKTAMFMRGGNNEIYDSYLLKHLLEDKLTLEYGYKNPTLDAEDNNYVSNGAAKGAMLALGFATSPDDLKTINWSFNTSVLDWDKLQNDINKLKLGIK